MRIPSSGNLSMHLTRRRAERAGSGPEHDAFARPVDFKAERDLMTPLRPVVCDSPVNGADRPVSTTGRDRSITAFDPGQVTRTPDDACQRRAGAVQYRYRRFDLEIDLVRRHVCRYGQELAMTHREWVLVEALVRRAGSVWPRSDLRVLLSRSGPACSSNALSILLFNVRSKLGKDVIQTIRGRGYRLTPSNEAHGDTRQEAIPK